MKKTQISAFVSEFAKEELERYSRATGIKKGHLIEAAILHHLQALKELPADVVVPTRLVVSERSARDILLHLESPEPTQALRDLMTGGDQSAS